MFSKFEKTFMLVLCIMFSIAPVVLHSEGKDVLPLMPWAGFGIFMCLVGFILDFMFFKERPSRNEARSGK